MNQRFASLMSDLFALAGADESECFEENVAMLAIDGFDVSLTLLEDADQILVSTVVAEFPSDDKLPELQARLLEGNLFFKETQGFTLAARKDTGIVLHSVMPCAILDKSAIVTLVGNLITVAEYWRNICENSSEDIENTSEESQSFVPEMYMLRI